MYSDATVEIPRLKEKKKRDFFWRRKNRRQDNGGDLPLDLTRRALRDVREAKSPFVQLCLLVNS